MKCPCGKQIGDRTKYGKCLQCTARLPEVRAGKGKLTPEQRAARSASAKALSADPEIIARRGRSIQAANADPAIKAKRCAAAKAGAVKRMNDPVMAARMSEFGRTVGLCNLRRAHNPISREKARAKIQRKHLAWCPEEHWDTNQMLKRAGYKLDERKAMILADVPGTAEHARRSVENSQIAMQIKHERDLASQY